MSNRLPYNEDFFVNIQIGSELSARVIVPLVIEIIKPSNVVDVGCGTGEFLKVFQECGVDEILGIDGKYVERKQLAIPQKCFRDLDVSKPFTIDKTYDLAVCLEVAEHLPSESASELIESLTRLAPVILFSAAIPHQGGTHHVNEQWLDYWIELFKARGFQPVDALRKRIWNNRQIAWWYRQNIILFCTEQILVGDSILGKAYRETNLDQLSLVHPDLFIEKCNYFDEYYKERKQILNRLKALVKKSRFVSNIYYSLRH